MTRQEAIKGLKVLRRDFSGYKPNEEMFDMAIEALEREPKRGKWIDYTEEGFVECPFCHSATTCDDNIDDLKFCFLCGAKMESDEK